MAFDMQTAGAGQVGIAHAARVGERRHGDFNDDAAFIAMRAAYHPLGGLARGDEKPVDLMDSRLSEVVQARVPTGS